MKGNTKLKVARKMKGISQKEMAQLLNISQIAYNMLEMQKVSGKISTWQQIQTILEIPDEEMWDIMNHPIVKENE